MNTPRGRIAFAVCGSFCTLGTATAQAGRLVRQGWEPVSYTHLTLPTILLV